MWRGTDYNQVDFTEVLKDVDAALDTVGGAVAEQTLTVLRRGGRAAFIGGPVPTTERPDVRALKPPVRRSTSGMNRVAELIETGAVRPPEIKRYSLREAAEAHQVSEARHFRGKLVFEVR